MSNHFCTTDRYVLKDRLRLTKSPPLVIKPSAELSPKQWKRGELVAFLCWLVSLGDQWCRNYLRNAKENKNMKSDIKIVSFFYPLAYHSSPATSTGRVQAGCFSTEQTLLWCCWGSDVVR